ncbi:MAG: insulinase family protein [Prevotellaceae bacterium]|jgi:zinc protease|nr:insulinase family protein [Prevotellaceae bacterium]
MRKNKFQSAVILLLLFIGVVHVAAQQMPPVPIDSKIRYGKLDNGLTYYIRANQQPKDRAEFYIAQNVGAILEEDHQNGLAHFLEHMAFNGTKHFPGKGIINYFESVGVRFGYNINAYTSLDETVYNLSNVPTTREGIIDSALLVLHDWSSFIALEGGEIDSERGVIREEWRTGAQADRRMWKAANSQKYPGSQYAKRDVIGDTAVINNFSHQALRDFYEKWYRPDLQAILIVGDVNVDEIEAKIKTLFSDIPKKANAGERPIYPVLDNEEPIVSIVKDREAAYTRIQLEYKKEKLPADFKLSVSGYGFSIINNLISQMLNERLQEITQQADASFVAGFSYYGELVKSKDAFILIAVPKEGQELKALYDLAVEGERMQRFGFTNAELERAKTDLLARIEKTYNDRDNQENNALVNEYVRHYLDDEPVPGIEWEYQTLQLLLPQLSLDMVNQLAKTYITDENLIISFTAPDKESLQLPGKDEILAAVKSVNGLELTAKEEEDVSKPLIEQTPKAGKIKKVTQNNSLGTTEWLLSNNVKVVFKPTRFKQDEILFSAFSEGGLSKVANVSDLPSAVLATSIADFNGLGNFNQTDLRKALTGKIASVSPYIGSYSEGFSGNSSVKDFETMLQLIYLNFTAVRKDDNAYQAFINMLRTSLANADSNPKTAFSDTINLLNANRHPRAVLLKLNTLEQVSQDKALSIFKERFANPADFIFVFTGSIDPENEAVKKAVATYLGALKTQKGKEKYTDHNIRKPNGKVNNYFSREMETKTASNYILYSGATPYNVQNRTTFTAIGNILFNRYLESIREKEGGSYGVGVRGNVGDAPVQEATLYMQFDTDPEKQESLLGIIHAEVDEIIANGAREDDLQKVKENLLKQYSEDLEENAWWRNALVLYYQNGLNLVKDYKASVEALTSGSIQQALKTLVEQGNVLEVVMSPEK